MKTIPENFLSFTLAKLFVAAVLASLTIHTWSHAATVTVSGTMTSISDYGNDFRVGDQFDFSFTFDDQALDTAVETYNGLFSDGVTAFSLSRHATNTGTWNPASGSFAVSPVRNFTVNANGEGITVQAAGSGFPTVGGSPFLDVVLSFSWATGTNSVPNFIDTGSGQTFADMVGVSPLDFSTASGFVYGEIRSGPDFILTVDALQDPGDSPDSPPEDNGDKKEKKPKKPKTKDKDRF